MRWSSLLVSVLLLSYASAQWVNVPVDVPVGMGYAGPGEVTEVCMIAPGVGFCATSVVYSPSNGSGQSLYFTDTEWGAHAIVGGFSNNAVDQLKAKSATAVFAKKYHAGYTLSSINRLPDGSTVTYHYPVSSVLTLTMEPIADTVCIASTRDFSGIATVMRVTPHTNTILDTVPGVMPYILDIAFHDPLIGALLIHGPGQRATVRMTQDGGNTWSEVWSDTTDMPQAMAWANDHSLWLVGDSGLVMTTADIGGTWNVVPRPTENDLLTISIGPSHFVWVGGVGGKVYASNAPEDYWQEHSLADSMVMQLKAFDGVIYASTARRLYRFGALTGDLPPTDGWCVNTATGFVLSAPGPFMVSDVLLFDLMGRSLRPETNGNAITMTGYPTGSFILHCRIDGEERTAKLCWPGSR